MCFAEVNSVDPYNHNPRVFYGLFWYIQQQATEELVFVSCKKKITKQQQNKPALRGNKDPSRLYPSLSDGDSLACSESLYSNHVPTVLWVSHMIWLWAWKTSSPIDRNFSCDADWQHKINQWLVPEGGAGQMLFFSTLHVGGYKVKDWLHANRPIQSKQEVH